MEVVFVTESYAPGCWRNKQTINPDSTNYIAGSGDMLPRENFGKLDSRKRHILHSLDRTQLIYTCILLSFSLSLVIHDSLPEVQRFMIPKFLKQRFKMLTCFVSMIHDSWFPFHPRFLFCEKYAFQITHFSRLKCQLSQQKLTQHFSKDFLRLSRRGIRVIKVILWSFQNNFFFKFMLSKTHFDVTIVFTYSRGNKSLGLSERSYYLPYFIYQ